MLFGCNIETTFYSVHFCFSVSWWHSMDFNENAWNQSFLKKAWFLIIRTMEFQAFYDLFDQIKHPIVFFVHGVTLTTKRFRPFKNQPSIISKLAVVWLQNIYEIAHQYLIAWKMKLSMIWNVKQRIILCVYDSICLLPGRNKIKLHTFYQRWSSHLTPFCWKERDTVKRLRNEWRHCRKIQCRKEFLNNKYAKWDYLSVLNTSPGRNILTPQKCKKYVSRFKSHAFPIKKTVLYCLSNY